MKCPYCGNGDTKVLNSRPVQENDSIRRRRQCEKCNKRFTTYEKIETLPLMVIKRDQSRETYERDKLLKGILRSCNKRNVTREQIENLVDEIENQMAIKEAGEISSTELGEIAMRYLKQLDEVSYIRFASVYKQFVCIEEFITELESIRKQK